MAKKRPHQAPEPHTPFQNGRLVERMRQFSSSGFAKGMAVTAILFITALVLVAGTMGAGALGGLSVGGVMLPDFGAGVAAGFSKMLAFLVTTPLGWGTLAAGGLIGSHLQHKRDKELIAMDELLASKDQEVAQELEKLHQLEQQIAMQPQAQQSAQRDTALPQAENRAAPMDNKTAEQIYSEGYLNGIKTAKAPQETPVKTESARDDRAIKTEPTQPDQQHVNQVYSQGYLDGIRTAQEAAAGSGNSSQPPAVAPPAVVNVQNVISNDQINAEISAPTINNPLNDNSLSQVAIASTNTPVNATGVAAMSAADKVYARSASFSATELKRQTEREMAGTKHTV